MIVPDRDGLNVDDGELGDGDDHLDEDVEVMSDDNAERSPAPLGHSCCPPETPMVGVDSSRRRGQWASSSSMSVAAR